MWEGLPGGKTKGTKEKNLGKRKKKRHIAALGKTAERTLRGGGGLGGFSLDN